MKTWQLECLNTMVQEEMQKVGEAVSVGDVRPIDAMEAVLRMLAVVQQIANHLLERDLGAHRDML